MWSRVGAMWAGFVIDLYSVPEPAEWPDDLRQLYRDSLKAASEPLFRRALSAYATCASYAHKYKLEDSFARSCDEWLASNKP